MLQLARVWEALVNHTRMPRRWVLTLTQLLLLDQRSLLLLLHFVFVFALNVVSSNSGISQLMDRYNDRILHSTRLLLLL